MSNPVAQCTHVKTNGEACGSPAVSGTEFCYHHSAIKTALGKARPNGKAVNGAFAPIPFVFPEDRASMQINFFLLLQAYNEQRIDRRTYNSMLSMLKAMAKNLGKTGSLVGEPSDPRSAVSDQEAVRGKSVSETNGLELLVDLKASAIAPESCFSTNPKPWASEERTVSHELAGCGRNRTLNKYFAPPLGR